MMRIAAMSFPLTRIWMIKPRIIRRMIPPIKMTTTRNLELTPMMMVYRGLL